MEVLFMLLLFVAILTVAFIFQGDHLRQPPRDEYDKTRWLHQPLDFWNQGDK